jgi:hypothetical protein
MRLMELSPGGCLWHFGRERHMMRPFALEASAGSFALTAGDRRIVRLDLPRLFWTDI